MSRRRSDRVPTTARSSTNSSGRTPARSAVPRARAGPFDKSLTRLVRSVERAPQLFGHTRRPCRIERPRVTQRSCTAHPAGQVGVFRQITDARQLLPPDPPTGSRPNTRTDARLRRGIAEHVLEQRGLPRAVGAHEARTPRLAHREAHVVERHFFPEAPRDLPHFDHAPPGAGDNDPFVCIVYLS